MCLIIYMVLESKLCVMKGTTFSHSEVWTTQKLEQLGWHQSTSFSFVKLEWNSVTQDTVPDMGLEQPGAWPTPTVFLFIRIAVSKQFVIDTLLRFPCAFPWSSGEQQLAVSFTGVVRQLLFLLLTWLICVGYLRLFSLPVIMFQCQSMKWARLCDAGLYVSSAGS